MRFSLDENQTIEHKPSKRKGSVDAAEKLVFTISLPELCARVLIRVLHE